MIHSGSTNTARALIGLCARAVFWLCLLWIVGTSVSYSWRSGDVVSVKLKVVFFPLTYFLSPWYTGLWGVFLVSIVAYWVSTLIGGLRPVE